MKIWCPNHWTNGANLLKKWWIQLDSNQRPLGYEPSALTKLSYGSTYMAYLEGFEPPTHALEGRCSIQLSYRYIWMVRHTRFELVTTRLKVVCSTNWANDANGVTDGDRTRDNQCHKLALYQLNYGHHYNISFWSGKRGSNSRHSAWKADALPTELFPHFNGRNSKIWTCGPLLPRQVRYRAALYSVLKYLISLPYINIIVKYFLIFLEIFSTKN